MNRNQITNAWRITLNDSNEFYILKDEIVRLDIGDNMFIQGKMKGVSDSAVNIQLGTSNIAVNLQDIKGISSIRIIGVYPNELTEETLENNV